MKRMYHLPCYAAIVATATFLGYKAEYGGEYDQRILALEKSIKEVESRVQSEAKRISAEADEYVRAVARKTESTKSDFRKSETTRESEYAARRADHNRKLSSRRTECEAEMAVLDRDFSTRQSTVGAFAYASEAGMPELVDDIKELELGLERLRAEADHLRRLHEAFKRRQFLSKSIRTADGAVETVEEALSYIEGKLRDAKDLASHAEALTH